MTIAFITFNSSLVPLIEGLCSSNPWEFEFLEFIRNRTDDLGINSLSLWPTEPRLQCMWGQNLSGKTNKMPETSNECVREGDTTWNKLTQQTTNECQIIKTVEYTLLSCLTLLLYTFVPFALPYTFALTHFVPPHVCPYTICFTRHCIPDTLAPPYTFVPTHFPALHFCPRTFAPPYALSRTS